MKELLRWALVLLFGGATLLFIGIGGARVFSGSATLHWSEALAGIFLVLLIGLTPASFAVLAFLKRWRDIVVLLVLLGSFFGWIFLGRIAEVEFNKMFLNVNAPWRFFVEFLLSPLMRILLILVGAKWFAGKVQHLVARVVPPNEF